MTAMVGHRTATSRSVGVVLGARRCARGAVRLVSFSVPIVALLLFAQEARSQKPDLQLWTPVQVIHRIDDDWTVSMQTELRLQDDISEFSELILKPALNHHFNETFALSVGYKYIDKYQEANEQDPWQELHINHKHNDLVSGLQFRLEERLIDDIDGVIPRLRVLQHLSHPIGEGPFYLTGFGALRFNLDDKGEGPVYGFEQSRVYAALGRHIGEQTQLELGYLWRWERERQGPNKNDHALHLQLVYHTYDKPIKKPAVRDRYR